jgi:Tfp pilus assembly protein PilN
MLEKYYRISQAAGVSIHIGSDNAVETSACLISMNNDALTFDKKQAQLTPEKLKGLFPAGTLTGLNLSGKGILYRQTEKIDDIDATNFNKILPNGNPEDFYIQNFVSGEYSFVAIIRKTEADHWMQLVTNAGLVPVMLSLGPFPVQHILAQLNLYDSVAVFNGYTISRADTGEWLSWHYDSKVKAQFPIKAESEVLHESLLLPYAAAFQLALADKVEPVSARVVSLATTLHETIKERKLKAQGFLILAAFFVLLLINFAVFSWLNSANNSLGEAVSRTAQNSGDIDKMNQQVQQKENLLKTLGWEDGINKSTLVDQAASLLPPDIQFKEIAIDPVDIAASRQQKQTVFYVRKIRMTGASEKIIPVNEWIARLKTRPWVKNVQMDSYTFNSEQNTGQFTVTIAY